MWGQVSHNCTVLHHAVPRRACEEAGSWLKDSAVLVPPMGSPSLLIPGAMLLFLHILGHLGLSTRRNSHTPPFPQL